MKTEFTTYDYKNVRKIEYFAHEREMLSQEARIAVDLVRHFGVVACIPDPALIGPDGRQKLTLQTPKEVVERATEIASLLMQELRRRDLVTELPPISDLLIDRE